MACLETKPQMYSTWWSKMMKNPLKIDSSEPQNNDGKMNAEIDSPSAERVDVKEAEKKISSLKNLLKRDPQAADFKWSLFIAACHTYRHDSCLKPFPPMYTKNETRDIEALREAIEVIPPLAIMYERLEDPKAYENHKSTIDLLYWVLITLRDPHIKSVNKNLYETILNKVPSELSAVKPNLIFQVVSPNQSTKEERWKATTQSHSTFFAYHGSRLENFHSIVHYGIQQHMSKNGIFGTGIYLSSELGVSLRWSPVGYGWGGSMLGSEISCIALCELVNHPDVKKGDSDDANNSVRMAIGKKIPNKYYLAINSDLVRVRYLLVYSQDFGISRRTQSNGLVGWFKQNKFLTLVLGYVVLLVSVGLTNNKNVEKYYKFLIQKIGLD
ncbi:hypothetical protein PV325_013838 [Microctonus aethiopoides]|uniref:Poly [ADP-ribose] polymerase n=1 Tax=Microctonus aethiopoides TaxID=144406 RepID=A0AA39KU21_9HYME|nr:hypothetical protein PV325_013838 [Microctonus aethiopoides]KAK0173712.1 hypothetical protein PV328_006869 [Microctonus aethiopoides]